MMDRRRGGSSPRHLGGHIDRLDVAWISALVVLGALYRMTGFTRSNLWFDDAWAAMTSKVSLGTAMHMVATTPLYSLGMRSWILAGPSSTVWAQLPAFLLGLIGIVAVFVLAKEFGFGRMGRCVMAVAIVLGPVAAAYSMRVKEYSADLVLACLLLILAERWRRSPSGRGLLAWTSLSIVSVAISASTGVVIAGTALMMVMVGVKHRDQRRQLVLAGCSLAGAGAVLYLVWFRNVAASLDGNWRNRGYLLDLRGFHPLWHSIVATGSNFAHGLFGLPVPWSPYPLETLALTVASAVVGWGLLAVILVVVIRELLTGHRQRVAPFVAPAIVVGLAVVLWAIDRIPLGGGRTDEVLYPAVLLLLGFSCARASSFVRSKIVIIDRAVRRPATGMIAAGVAACGLVAFGVGHRIEYPTTDLTSLAASLHKHLAPGESIVVDGFESFPWGYAGLSKTAVSFSAVGVVWPQGYHLISLSPRVVMSQSYLGPDDQIRSLSQKTRSIWFVGATNASFSGATPVGLRVFPMQSNTLNALLALGWQFEGLPLSAPGVYAAHLSFAGTQRQVPAVSDPSAP